MAVLRFIVNGEPREIAAATLAEALAALDYEGAVVATALNGAFVPKRQARGDGVEGWRPHRDRRAATRRLNGAADVL